MNRSLTTDQVIGIEALRLALGQSMIASDNYVYGLMKTLQINNDSISETNMMDQYIAGNISITDLLIALEVEVKDGEEENQFEGQGSESGTGTDSGVEQTTASIDETDAAILRQHRGG